MQVFATANSIVLRISHLRSNKVGNVKQAHFHELQGSASSPGALSSIGWMRGEKLCGRADQGGARRTRFALGYSRSPLRGDAEVLSSLGYNLACLHEYVSVWEGESRNPFEVGGEGETVRTDGPRAAFVGSFLGFLFFYSVLFIQL